MKLNLGCGHDIQSGYINVDINKNSEADLIYNLDNLPWTWNNNSIECIRMIDILEHLQNTTGIINECHRILINGGELLIQVPNTIQCPYNAFTDPTHVRFFTDKTFDYWDPTTDIGIRYGFYFDKKFNIIDKKIHNNIEVTLKKIEV